MKTTQLIATLAGLGMLSAGTLVSSGNPNIYYDEDIVLEEWILPSSGVARGSEYINVYYDEDIAGAPTYASGSGGLHYRLGFYDEDTVEADFAAFE